MSPMPENAKVIEGSEAVAQAVRVCRPEVISAFPISPQTHIVEGLAKMAADGKIDSEYVRVESEFSAASVLAGSSAAGARSYTASSSQGLPCPPPFTRRSSPAARRSNCCQRRAG